MSISKTRLTHEGAALLSVVLESLALGFRLRAAGKRTGHVTAGGNGIWGFLHSLATDGPQTVPALARARPVSRQHIQAIANEAAAEGLVVFVANPRHKRSKLVALTEQGRALHAELTHRLAALSIELARGMDAAELETAARVLSEIKRRLAAH
jgi:DNA-binding MarR family transcriptional regulator